MTSSFTNDTSKQSHSSQTLRSVASENLTPRVSSLVRLLEKRKPTKSASFSWEHFIKVEGCDP